MATLNDLKSELTTAGFTIVKTEERPVVKSVSAWFQEVIIKYLADNRLKSATVNVKNPGGTTAEPPAPGAEEATWDSDSPTSALTESFRKFLSGKLDLRVGSKFYTSGKTSPASPPDPVGYGVTDGPDLYLRAWEIDNLSQNLQTAKVKIRVTETTDPSQGKFKERYIEAWRQWNITYSAITGTIDPGHNVTQDNTGATARVIANPGTKLTVVSLSGSPTPTDTWRRNVGNYITTTALPNDGFGYQDYGPV